MKRGFTLAEVAVYGVLALLAASLLLTVLLQTRRMFGQVTATFLVDRAFDRALVVLRQDLEESSLTSLRAYPAPAGRPGDKEPPGLTLASAAGEVTREGVPRWNRQVFYTLKGDSGSLLRWERPMEKPGGAPLASLLLPSPNLPDTRVETVLRDVQLPNTTLPGIPESKVGPQGGFQVKFVRRSQGKEELSNWNPAEVSLGQSDDDARGNTRLVDLELRVFRPADSVSASQYAVVRCRVCPRSR